MSALLSDKTWHDIKGVFARAYPREAIVALHGDEWTELENVHPEPTLSFRLRDEDRLSLLDNPPSLFLHSHPQGSPEPSDRDTEQQIATGWTWGIVAVQGNPITGAVFDIQYPEIWGAGAQQGPLEGRSYLWGIRDCWTLCWDYYGAHGHDLPAIPRVREPGGHHSDPRKVDPFAYWPAQLGFKPVASRADRQEGDLCVMYWKSPQANHVAVYLGNGQYLHQVKDTLSNVFTAKDEERLLERMAAQFWRLP